jgi:hypothetical protein
VSYLALAVAMLGVLASFMLFFLHARAQKAVDDAKEQTAGASASRVNDHERRITHLENVNVEIGKTLVEMRVQSATLVATSAANTELWKANFASLDTKVNLIHKALNH